MTVSAQQLRRQRIELILLFALPILGTLLMTGYYYFVVDRSEGLGTHNKGELISPPKPTTELSLRADGQPYSFADDSGKWTFLVLGNADCAERCQQKLYLTRQIREALGKYRLRVRTVYLSQQAEQSEQLQQLLQGEYQAHQLITVDRDSFQSWANQQTPMLSDIEAAHDVSFYVLDPAGWLMMFYSDAHNYKQVISDMKFLIKNS